MIGKVGFHAAHERFAPSYLLRCLKHAEEAGFDLAMCSDHFHPWTEQQGESGFTWTWLGAALATTNLTLGTVSAPGQRYHPAILAQAIATADEMFPGRIWVALGTGQMLNEAITGQVWPTKSERRERLRECVDIMRALWRGELVSHHGRVCVEEVRLYTRPSRIPPVFGAALTMETAAWSGSWADGLITGGGSPEQLKKIREAFYQGGGEGKPIYSQVSHMYCEDEEEGARIAHQNWKANVLGAVLQAELRLPTQFDAASKYVRVEDIKQNVRISREPGRHAEWIQQDFEAGADTVFIHHVGCDQDVAIEFFGNKVIPLLK